MGVGATCSKLTTAKIHYNNRGGFMENAILKFKGYYVFLILLALLLLPSASFAEWTIEAVDAPKIFTVPYQRAIAVDGYDKPHVAYGRDRLYYAYFDGSQWQYETVDSSPGVGYYASIALDSNNKAHISYYYYDETNGHLKYATNVSGAWVVSTVDSAAIVGMYTSIAVDSDNKVHISYFDEIYEDLKYATNASGAWVVSAVDSSGDVGKYTSIAIDSDNKAHISYYV